MKHTCNGATNTSLSENIEITRLEPVVIEVEEEGNISSHLIVFELIYKLDVLPEEIHVNGEIQQTIFQMNAREEE